MALTLGTQFQVDTDGDDLVRVAGLTFSTAIAIYSSAASGIEARHLTNSSGTITGGAVLPIDANQADSVAICALTSSSVLIGYAYGATHRVRVLTVSGTTLIPNAITNMTDTGVDFLACQLLDTNKIIYAYSASNGDGTSRILSISGTTVTENAAFTYYSASDAYHNALAIYTTVQALVVWINQSNSRVRGELLDISGTTITGNTEREGPAAMLGSSGGDRQLDVSARMLGGTFPTDCIVVACDGSNQGYATFYENLGGGGLTSGAANALLATSTANSISISYVDGDRSIVVVSDTNGPNLEIIELDYLTEEDTDTSVSTDAGTSSVDVKLLPASTTAVATWEATTEAITVSLPGAALTLSAMTKPASLSADGLSIYVALLEGGTPILTKISTVLSSDGTTVFNPGAGTNIGVECGRSDANVVWVAGAFDGTNVVEKSEDAGSTFTVADDATIGNVRAFVMGPDSDDRLLVFDETNGDILETIDSGTTWTNINASVTPEVNAIGRLGENVQESVFGNDGAANDSIDYSVNSGDDLEDFQTGVYPNANATGIIVN